MSPEPNQEKYAKTRGWSGWVAFFMITGILSLMFGKRPWNILTSCGLLFFAWSIYYDPRPSVRSTTKGIYQFYRKKNRLTSPKYLRTVMLLSLILMVTGSIGSCSLIH